MNFENLDRLITAIKKENLVHKGKPVKFFMPYWMETTDCNTFCCIGGHCEILSGNSSGAFCYIVADFLGISTDQAYDLCYARDTESGLKIEMSSVTKKDAIRVLEELRRTGEVNWAILGRTL